MQRAQCDSPATLQCNDDDCNAVLCTEHDRSAHSNSSGLAHHQRLPVTQTSNVAPLSGSSGNSNNGKDASSNNNSAVAATASASSLSAAGHQTATVSDTAVNGIRIVAQRDEQGRPHGFGCEVDATGKMITGRCGAWNLGLLLEHRAVPLSLMPASLFAEERARGTVLLCIGTEYRGELDDRYQAHGEGCLCFSDGRVQQKGTYEHGWLTTGFAEWLDGDTYDGEWKDGVPHGKGKYIQQSDGSIYEGIWRDDQLVSGRRRHPNGVLKGSFDVDGMLHGPNCVFVLSVGDRYEGALHHGLREGVSKLTWSDGQTYDGQWVNDVRSGLGVQRAPDRTILGCGAWAQDEFIQSCSVPRSALPAGSLPHLDDSLLFPDGRTFRGPVDQQRQPHGEGSMHYANGTEQARGTWVEGKLHGPACIVVMTNGNRYEGGMKFGKQDGMGHCVWHASGDRYEGSWAAGDKEGIGKYEWKETGETYDGQWSKGVRRGSGVQRRRDGTILHCGEWSADKFIKSCPVPRSAVPAGALPHPDDTLLFPDGRIFRGPLNAHNQPHGVGGMCSVDGSESRGDWTAGALNGLGLLRMPNGDVFEGQLKAGKRKGFGALWNTDGKLLKCGEWSSGWLFELDSRPVSRRFIPFGEKLNVLSRDATLFYPSGDYFVGALNAQDQPDGEGTLYSAHGLIKQQGVWSNGRFVRAAPPVSAVSGLIDPAPKSCAEDPGLTAAAAGVAPPSLPAAPPHPPASVNAADAPMDVDTPLSASDQKAAVAAVGAEIPAACAPLLPVRPRRRSALCIGNNNYSPPLPPLKCCWTDAERMSCALHRLQFDSSLVRTDLDYSSLNREIDGFIASLVQQQFGPGDLALLYYSGHGCEVGTNNVCLLPTDIGDEDGDYGGLSVHMVKRRFNREAALTGVQVVIIVESCRVGECPTVNLNALIEQAQEQAHADQCAAETRRADKEQAIMRRLRRQQEAEEREYSRDHDDSASEQSEPSYSLSSSSSSLPVVRPQSSIPPHADDLTRAHFAAVYSCDSGHLAFTGWNGASVFSTCFLDEISASGADLSISGLVERTNARMEKVTADQGVAQVASVILSTARPITLAACATTKPQS